MAPLPPENMISSASTPCNTATMAINPATLTSGQPIKRWSSATIPPAYETHAKRKSIMIKMTTIAQSAAIAEDVKSTLIPKKIKINVPRKPPNDPAAKLSSTSANKLFRFNPII